MTRIVLVGAMLAAACGGKESKPATPPQNVAAKEPEQPKKPEKPATLAEVALAKFTKWTDEMCACSAGDTTCAEKILDEQKHWAEDMAKHADKDEKPDLELAKQFEPIMERYTKCMTTVMTPPTP